MSNGKLTLSEAIESTIERWQGSKVRDLGAKYDVDPRRLYEVWQGKSHPSALLIAYKKFLAINPEAAKKVTPTPIKPKFKVQKLDAEQLDLFK